MNEQENLVTNEVAENAEVTAEQFTGQGEVAPVQQESVAAEQSVTAKTYTEEEFNQKFDEVLGKKLARREAKIRKEYESKYGELESVLKAATGKNDVAEMTDTFKTYYQSKGVQIPSGPSYSDRDIEVLAWAEAEDIINSGFEEVVEEVDRLASLGAKNMNAREKALFKTLAEYRQNTERKQELAKIGVTEDVYGSKEFKEFAAKFSSATPVTEIYEIYNKMQPKKEVRPMGSMKNNTSGDTGVKDFYTRDEALKFTKKDFDKNPALFKAVEASMLKW